MQNCQAPAQKQWAPGHMNVTCQNTWTCEGEQQMQRMNVGMQESHGASDRYRRRGVRTQGFMGKGEYGHV